MVTRALVCVRQCRRAAGRPGATALQPAAHPAPPPLHHPQPPPISSGLASAATPTRTHRAPPKRRQPGDTQALLARDRPAGLASVGAHVAAETGERARRPRLVRRTIERKQIHGARGRYGRQLMICAHRVGAPRGRFAGAGAGAGAAVARRHRRLSGRRAGKLADRSSLRPTGGGRANLHEVACIPVGTTRLATQRSPLVGLAPSKIIRHPLGWRPDRQDGPSGRHSTRSSRPPRHLTA